MQDFRLVEKSITKAVDCEHEVRMPMKLYATFRRGSGAGEKTGSAILRPGSLDWFSGKYRSRHSHYARILMRC